MSQMPTTQVLANQFETRNAALTQLVQAAQRGNRETLAKLTEQFQPLVLSVAGRYHNVSREDAVQEGFLSLLECIMRFDATRGVPFTGYVNLKVRGDVRTAMRKIWRYDSRVALAKQDEEGNAVPGLDNVPSSPLTSQTSDFELAEWGIVISRAGLSPREQLGLQSLIQGWSSTEIGKRTGVSAETVKTWRKRGVRKIRSRLNKTSE